MRSKLRSVLGVSVLLGFGTACGNTSSEGAAGAPSGGAGGDAGARSDGGGAAGMTEPPAAGADAGGADSAGGEAGAAGSAGDSSGGTSAGGGSGGLGGGSGGSIDIGPQLKSDKLDVLFVVDNSVSMADKQNILEASLPHFVKRLINPLCVDALGKPAAEQPASAADPCGAGSSREFTPVASMHFGVITTSLGGHGGSVCAPAAGEDMLDDRGELVPKLRTGVPSYMGSGYLSYDATGAAGVTDSSALVADLQATVSAAGEHGCGFEAPLEAMYRFLVDPEPPVAVTQVNGVSTPGEINTALLAERAAFLRPDSSVAIVILSDENDCSVRDDGVGWFVGASSRMPRASSACEANPNDPCCRSCATSEASPPAGCQPIAQDSACQTATGGQTYATWDAEHDSPNLRCFDQTRRFGFDLLYPVDRYSNALSNPKLKNRAGALVDNPLLAARDGQPARSATLVSISMIIGAPWQDLAKPASLDAAHPLEYLNGAGLAGQGRWPVLLGSPELNLPPADPFMRESIAPRSGTNPLTSAPVIAETSTNPGESPINGHEQNITLFDDLQYACTFALPTPKACANGDATCDCSADKNGNASMVTTTNSPLCQPPEGGPAGTTQYYGKGHPGARELTLAKQLGDRAVGGSVCPKVMNDVNSVDYAYTPALNALIGRIASTLK